MFETAWRDDIDFFNLSIKSGWNFSGTNDLLKICSHKLYNLHTWNLEHVTVFKHLLLQFWKLKNLLNISFYSAYSFEKEREWGSWFFWLWKLIWRVSIDHQRAYCVPNKIYRYWKFDMKCDGVLIVNIEVYSSNRMRNSNDYLDLNSCCWKIFVFKCIWATLQLICYSLLLIIIKIYLSSCSAVFFWNSFSILNVSYFNYGGLWRRLRRLPLNQLVAIKSPT